MTKNFVKDLHIENFKSIKDLTFSCKRINLFIGRPNVGKSNILEGLSLLHFPNGDPLKPIESVIRHKKLFNLFFEFETDNCIAIVVENKVIIIQFDSTEDKFSIISFTGNNVLRSDIKYLKILATGLQLFFSNSNKNQRKKTKDFKLAFKKILVELNYSLEYIRKSLNLLDDVGFSLVFMSQDGKFLNGQIDISSFNIKTVSPKSYNFNGLNYNENFQSPVLEWPNGENIASVIEKNKHIRKKIGEVFNEYGYDLVVNKVYKELGILKNVDGVIFQVSIDLVADTLQRYIFHLAAINSNKDSILILEEPESHCFPEYISVIADEIIKSESNQFFIATHSPYILNEILEKGDRKDVAIHLTYFEDYQTKVKTLSNEELSELVDYGIDIFFNLENYLQDVKK
jgi:hypothetical protein